MTGFRKPGEPEREDINLDQATKKDQDQNGKDVKPANALLEMTIADLPEHLREGFTKAGWTELMPVQAKTLPYIMSGRDVMIQSRTGSGKTGAYLLPILDRIDPQKSVCQALILVPTRELARQVITDAETLGSGTGIRTVAVYGGVSYGPQLQAFRSGVQIVVGTPGRILDHLLKRSLSLDEIKILVFDEADRMLSMGFYPDMQRVRSYLPKRKINSCMFSATFPPQILRLAKEFLDDPVFLNLSRDHIHVTDSEHVFYTVPGMDKDRSLVRIIEMENPASALIFCNTKARVHYVSVVLQRFGYNADELSSDLSQKAREKVMRRIRKGELRFLVATDVAARGIDLPELSHVFLYEPPEDPESYIHRAGRTGRAGASGMAISLVNVSERPDLLRIARRFDIDLQELTLPSDEDVANIVTQRTIAMLEAQMRTRDRLKIERMQRFIPLVSSLSESEDELTLMAMLLDDFYQKNFHNPPEIIAPREDEHRKSSSQSRKGRSKSSRRRGKGGRRKN
jgi:ATP-dependent RNA helicase DeaD